jgi:transposase
VAELLQQAHAEEASVPALALDMLRLLAAQLDALDVKLKLIETRLMALHRENPVSQCLASQPGIGPIGAVSFALRVTDPKSFGSGRHFAAWLGLTPKDNSSGGKRRQGRISRQGNEALHKLVVLGATAVILFAQARPSVALVAQSARAQAEEVAAIALANKMARTLWAMMVSGEFYRRPLPV